MAVSYSSSALWACPGWLGGCGGLWGYGVVYHDGGVFSESVD